MRNVLFRRIPREYKKDIVKFLILHFCLIGIVSIISGYIAGTGAVQRSYEKVVETSNIEDGHFITYFKENESTLSKLENETNTKIVYQGFYNDEIIEGKNTKHEVRIYAERNEINLPTVIKGRLPESLNEILINELYAKTNKIQLNEQFVLNSGTYTVVGFASFSDYITVYKNTTDFSMQYYTFTPAIVTQETFDSITTISPTHCYSYRFNERINNADTLKAKNTEFYDIATDRIILDVNVITEFVPVSVNNAIKTGDGFANQYDSFVFMFGYIVFFVLAFIFAVSTLSHISDEAKTIGTLRAMGYTKWQLIFAYLILPFLVTIVSTLIGNLIGHLCLAKMFGGLFTSMVSVPEITIEVALFPFLLTTLGPSILMLIVNFILITRMMNISPLNFLRNKLRKVKTAKAVKLPESFSFKTKFRIRTIIQNIPNFLILSFGIIMGSVLFSFGIVYKSSAVNQLNICETQAVSQYQYVLQLPIKTSNPDAEAYSAYSFIPQNKGYINCSVPAYGIKENSKYFDLTFSENEDEIVVSKAYSVKYNAHIGNTIKLKGMSGTNDYVFKVGAIYDYSVTPCIMMPIERMNEIILNDSGNKIIDTVYEVAKDIGLDEPVTKLFFNGYFTNTKLTDIDNKQIKTVVEVNSLVSDLKRINRTANTVAELVITLGVAMDILLTFLLTKQIIEKNQNNISMCKILGFDNKEIGGIYIVSTTIVAVIALLISLPLIYVIINPLLSIFAYPTMKSFMHFIFPMWIYPAAFGCGLVSYIIACIIQFTIIKKVPMVKALKDSVN